jgi:hypothetical protein
MGDMREIALVLGCGVLACGPRVGIGADDETPNEGTTGDAPVVTTAEPVTTSTDTGRSEEPVPPEPVPLLCFEQRLVWEGGGSPTLHLADTLGNGVPELWLLTDDDPIFAIGLAAVADTYEPYGSAFLEHSVIAWSDLNGNGRDDALGYSIGDDGLEWRVTLSDGTGVPSIPSPLEIDLPQIQGPSVGFFDATHDARADLFTSEDGLLHVFRGDGTGAFSPWTNTPLEPWRTAVVLRPSRFDPRAFAATLLPLADLQAVVSLFAIAPGGALVRYATTAPIDGHPIPIDMRPIDADERPDVAVQHDAANATVITIYLARDDGQLEDAWQSPEADAAAVGDFDGDGWLDVLWSRGGQAYALAALPSPQGGVPVEVDLAPAHPHLVADLDGDGREEIVQLRKLADTFTLEVIAAIDCP